MIVRGWLIVGGVSMDAQLPEGAFVGHHLGQLPEASNYAAGQWCYWQERPGGSIAKLVCVEIPL